MTEIERTFSTPEPIQLYVSTRAGTVRVVAEERDTAHVRVVGRTADEVVVEQDRRRVVVAAPRSRTPDPRLDVVVEVPARSRIGVETGSGDVEVVGDVEQVQAKSGSGDIEVERAHETHLTSGSGDLVLGSLTGRARTSTGSGDVRIGRVEVDAKALVKTGSGDVEVGVPDAVAVWTDIRTGSGDVTSSVGGRGAPGKKDPYVELQVSTGSGDIALVRAEDQPFMATPSRQ